MRTRRVFWEPFAYFRGKFFSVVADFRKGRTRGKAVVYDKFLQTADKGIVMSDFNIWAFFFKKFPIFPICLFRGVSLSQVHQRKPNRNRIIYLGKGNGGAVTLFAFESALSKVIFSPQAAAQTVQLANNPVKQTGKLLKTPADKMIGNDGT